MFIKRNIPKTCLSDFKLLYDEFNHQSSAYSESCSEVTSSFWKIHGSETLVQLNKEESVVHLRSAGFDDLRERNLINLIKNIPARILLRKYIAKLSSDLKATLFVTVRNQKRILTHNCVKQALSVKKVMEHGVSFEHKKVAVIGDGNGFLGIFLKTLFPASRIVFINLGKILMFDYVHTANCLPPPRASLNLVLNPSQYNPHADFNFIPAERIFDSKINDIDIFINIASMQEMDLSVIRRYFNFMRNQKKPAYFYCCNRESKILPDGSRIRFADYGWSEEDKIIFDEVCDWYFRYPISRPPFFRKFDGLHRHRLIEVSK